MRIERLVLTTADLAAQREFYEGLLGIECTCQTEKELTFRIGWTVLTFQWTSEPAPGPYHFAFNIPENHFAEAKNWLSSRAPLISDHQGHDEFFFEGWNAHAVYTFDPAGNILECIARHTLDYRAEGPFSFLNAQCVSEMGIAVPEPFFETTCRALGVAPYGGPAHPPFAALGDEEGLLIVVTEGREWFPDTGKRAKSQELEITFREQGLERNLTI